MADLDRKSSIRYAFYNLLNEYCKSRDFFSYRAGLLNYNYFNKELRQVFLAITRVSAEKDFHSYLK